MYWASGRRSPCLQIINVQILDAQRPVKWLPSHRRLTDVPIEHLPGCTEQGSWHAGKDPFCNLHPIASARTLKAGSVIPYVGQHRAGRTPAFFEGNQSAVVRV